MKPINWCVLLALLTVSVGAISCEGRSGINFDGTICAGAVWGKVTDTDGNPLDGVKVTLRDGVGTNMDTEGGGYFFIVGVNIGEEIDVRFDKTGYATTHKPVSMSKGVLTSLEMRMKAIERSGKRSTNSGLDEKLDDGSGINIPPGALVDSDGNTADGEIDVEITGLRVTSADIDAAPGNFRGLNSDGSETKMESYGILDMNFGKDGKPLQLAKGQTAQVTYPVDESKKAEGDVVPLWYYDTEKGKWISDGECTVQKNEVGDGLICVGNVTHFSTWNMDDPSKTTCLRGVIRDVEGRGVPGVSVRSYGKLYAGTDQQYSHNDGSFFILMQPGEDVEITFFKENVNEKREMKAPNTPYTDESSCEDMGEVKLVFDSSNTTNLPGVPKGFNLCVDVFDKINKACGQ